MRREAEEESAEGRSVRVTRPLGQALGKASAEPEAMAEGDAEESIETDRRGTVCIYCANVTAYSDKAKALLGHKLIDEQGGERALVVCLQEVHLDEEKCREEANRVYQNGWKTTWNAGKAREAGAGNTPGSMIAASGASMDFSARSLSGTIGDALGAQAWECQDCSFGILQLKEFRLLVINVYLTHTIGGTGVNVAKLAAVQRLIAMLGIPFVAVGDWNMTPEELISTGWPRKISGRLVVPPASSTCTSGKGRLIDYMVCCDQAMHLVEDIQVDVEGLWRPHVGFRVWLKGEPKNVLVQQILKPKKLQFLDFEKEVLEEEWDRQGEQHFAVRLLPKPEYINECLAYSQVEENIAEEKGGFFLGWARRLERTFGNLQPENLTKGRAQMPHTKLAKLKAARRSTTDHMFKDTCLAAWHALAARLAELSQLFAEGRRAGAE